MLQEREIVLVNPNHGGTYRSAKMHNEYLGLGSLASYLETQDRTSEIIDARLFKLTSSQAAVESLRFHPKVIGISMFAQPAAEWVNQFSQVVRTEDPSVQIVLGGYYPTLQTNKAMEIVPEADAIVRSEGEHTLADLALRILTGRSWDNVPGIVYRGHSGGIIQTNISRPLIKDIDKLPFPRRYAQESNIDEVLIEGSRGCFNRCVYCAIEPALDNPPQPLAWRSHSPEYIVAQMQELRKIYPQVNTFRFIDPEFFGSPGMMKRNLQIAELIKRNVPGVQLIVEGRIIDLQERSRPLIKALKAAGLVEVYIGLESGNEEILKRMHKGMSKEQALRATKLLEEEGIFYEFGFMMITPWSTEETVNGSVNLLRQISFLELHSLFTQMDVIPGTPAMVESGLIYPRGQSGYYTYDNEPFVEALKQLGKTFETSQKPFLETTWYLYQDIRLRFEAGDRDVLKIEKMLNQLVLEIFDHCYKGIKTGLSPQEIVDSCVEIYSPQNTEIDQILGEGIRYPRENE